MVTGERTRGVLLYALAALAVAAGAVWWVRAAPPVGADPAIARWRATAESALPAADGQQDAGTLALTAGEDHEVDANVSNGEYYVSVVCVGGPDSQARVSLGVDGSDTGRGLQCSGEQRPLTFKVSVAGQLRMNVTVNDAGPVIFRYTLAPSPGE